MTNKKNNDKSASVQFLIATATVSSLSLIGFTQMPAQATIYSGTNVGGSLWARPIGGGPFISGLGPVRYSSQAFMVDTTGLYNISSVQDYDGYIHLYENSFDPSDQLTNLLAGNDDGFGGIGTSNIVGLNLNSTATYILVTSAFAAGQEGTFTNTIEGDGKVTLKSETVPETSSVLGLLGMGTLGILSTFKRQSKSSASKEEDSPKVG